MEGEKLLKRRRVPWKWRWLGEEKGQVGIHWSWDVERLEEETKLAFEGSKWMGGKLRGSLVSLGIPVQDSAQ